MQLFLKNLIGKTQVINISKNDTIDYLKTIVENLELIPKNIQKLVYGGKYLSSGTIFDNNIEKESTIHLTLSLKGGGIPSFFRNIVKEYSGVTFWEKNKHVDHFFIDFNAMIYNVIRHIEGTDKMTPFEFENALLNRTLIQMERVISEVVKPRKSLQISMDGPPPRAKMVQQRHRRYKGIKEAEFHSQLERKYERSIRRLNWNKSAISPGTVFMKRLSDRIVDAIEKGKFNKHLKSGETLKIIFSDSSVPGEGEHKILPLIHDLKGTQDTIAVYSPDADMIVLSMITHKSEIFIFKENEQDAAIQDENGNKSEFLYLSVDRCRQGFISELYEKYEIEGMEPNEISDRFLIDYSFIMIFLMENF